MNIQPIVEGHGEVGAVPVVLRRLRDEAQAYALDVNPPIRRHRDEFFQEATLRKAVRLALKQEDCGAILVLVDGDQEGDCPRVQGPQLQAWAQSEAVDKPCAVVMAYREYEAWFLATIESLRGKRGIRPDAESHPRPEEPKGAKGQLELRMHPGRSYSETADQPALSAVFDMAIAYRRCRSFRRLVKAFGLLAAGVGVVLDNWPPPAWEGNPDAGPVVQGDNPRKEAREGRSFNPDLLRRMEDDFLLQSGNSAIRAIVLGGKPPVRPECLRWARSGSSPPCSRSR